MTTQLPDMRAQQDDVRVSIIVVTYGGLDLTRACVASLGRCWDSRDELVVVDNASPDGTGAWLESVEDRMTVLRNVTNRNFAGGCNDGARRARGRALCFLNNDTEVSVGWLDPLVDELDGADDIAVVGTRLVYPSGSIQHAGVVLERGGPPRHLQVGRPATHPDALATYDVQAVTAACMVVEREAFRIVGGFDEGYRNGAEDVDLCLALRDRGRRVVYVGYATPVIHHESVSDGRFAFATVNEQRLADRWSPTTRADLVVDEVPVEIAVPDLRWADPVDLSVVITGADGDDDVLARATSLARAHHDLDVVAVVAASVALDDTDPRLVRATRSRFGAPIAERVNAGARLANGVVGTVVLTTAPTPSDTWFAEAEAAARGTPATVFVGSSDARARWAIAADGAACEIVDDDAVTRAVQAAAFTTVLLPPQWYPLVRTLRTDCSFADASLDASVRTRAAGLRIAQLGTPTGSAAASAALPGRTVSPHPGVLLVRDDDTAGRIRQRMTTLDALADPREDAADPPELAAHAGPSAHANALFAAADLTDEIEIDVRSGTAIRVDRTPAHASRLSVAAPGRLRIPTVTIRRVGGLDDSQGAWPAPLLDWLDRAAVSGVLLEGDLLAALLPAPAPWFLPRRHGADVADDVRRYVGFHTTSTLDIDIDIDIDVPGDAVLVAAGGSATALAERLQRAFSHATTTGRSVVVRLDPDEADAWTRLDEAADAVEAATGALPDVVVVESSEAADAVLVRRAASTVVASPGPDGRRIASMAIEHDVAVLVAAAIPSQRSR